MQLVALNQSNGDSLTHVKHRVKDVWLVLLVRWFPRAVFGFHLILSTSYLYNGMCMYHGTRRSALPRSMVNHWETCTRAFVGLFVCL